MIATIDTAHGRFERVDISPDGAAIDQWIRDNEWVSCVRYELDPDAVELRVRHYIRTRDIISVSVLEEE